MLENIKSSFFNKILFSHLSKRNNLKLFKYNKNWQNILDINIKHYQVFSGRYIIYESKNKGKEYIGFDDILIYEGEFKNGERNGKGREYDDRGNLLYEGEFKNGKRNGKGKAFRCGYLLFEGEFLDDDLKCGKEYDRNGEKIINEIKENGFRKVINIKGNTIFEGEYLNGKRNGKGKEHTYEVVYNFIFEGEYLNGKKNGKGKLYLEYSPIFSEGETGDKILITEGEYFNGKEWNIKHYDSKGNLLYELKNGKGLVKDVYDYNNNAIKYEKEFLNGEANGKGKEYFENSNKIKFEGDYLNNNINGKGKEYDFNGKLIFEGEYINNHRMKGKEYLNGRLEYEGEYLFDKKYNGKGYDENGNVIYELINGDGKAIIYYNNCKRFEGEFLKEKKNGKGKLYEGDELIFESDYKDGKPNGKTKEYNSKGKLIFEGEYKDGLKNGMGKEYLNGELIYEGEYLKGNRWKGKCKKFSEEGKLIFDGEYLNGKINGKVKEFDSAGRSIFEGEYLNGYK